MKHHILTALAVGLVAGTAGAADKLPLETQKDKASYIIGMNFGKGMKGDGLDLNLDNFMAGLRAGFAGQESKISEADVRATMEAFQNELMARKQAEQAEALTKNTKAGADFLAANGKKAGIKTTASGLQYQVITEGKGRTPGAADQVTTHYRGTLLDGTEFDSSYKRNEPATFPVNGVIPGWTEALQLMKEGAKWKLFIPSKLAYGERGAGNSIPPHSTLIFDIELLKVN